MLFITTSCGSNEPALCINKYNSYSETLNAFSKCESKDYFIDISNISLIKNNQTSYYITGLCPHRPVHHEFNDICKDIYISDARIYSVGLEYSINYNVYSAMKTEVNTLTIKPYTSAYQEKLSYFFDSFLTKNGGYYPKECSSFQYLSVEGYEPIEKHCYLLLGGGNLVANIIYSNDTTSDIIERANKEILDLVQNSK